MVDTPRTLAFLTASQAQDGQPAGSYTLQRLRDFMVSELNVVPVAVSAAGTTQGTATVLTNQLNVVTSVAAGAGVMATSAYTKIWNAGSNALLVYPIASARFNALNINGSISVAAGGSVEVVMTSPTQGYVMSSVGFTPTTPVGVWYVDNLATSGTNSGTSWANAWTSFAAINWASIAAGHTIYISGGSTSKTYTTALTIGASGSAGSPIVISGGVDVGHNGTVIIDGTTSTTIFTSGGAVDFNSKTDVTVQNLTVQNCMENCVSMGIISSGTIIAQNLTIHTGLGLVPLVTNGTTAIGNATLHFASVPSIIYSNAASGFGLVDATTIGAISNTGALPTFTNGGTSTTLVMTNTAVKQVQSGDTINVGYNCRGIRIDGNTGGTIIVRNCTIDTPNNTVAQTDCIYSQLNDHAVSLQILNNNLTVNNIDPTGHNDCYQNFDDNCATMFAGNFCNQPNGGWNNHGMILTNIGNGAVQNYINNIFWCGQSITYGPGQPATALLLLTQNASFTCNSATVPATGTANFYNNTVLGGGWAALQISESGANANWVMKNNIFASQPITQSVYNLFTGNLGTPANLDYNLVYNTGVNIRADFLSGSGVVAVRGTQSRAVTTGLWYLEWQYGYTLGSGSTMFGFANSTQSLTTYPGSTTNSIGYDWQNGGVYTNAGNIATAAVANAPFDVFAVCFNTTTSKLWLKNLTLASNYAAPGVGTGGWNNDVIANQNPATGTGGVTTAGLAAGPWFPMVSLGGIGDHLLFTGTAPFMGTLPAGATAWGGTLNPSDKAASCSLTAAITVVSSSTQHTWATWQSAGYDTHGVNSDPLFTAAGQFTIQTGSPAKNAGVTLASVPTDYAGFTRPQSTSYCIGAYEYPL